MADTGLKTYQPSASRNGIVAFSSYGGGGQPVIAVDTRGLPELTRH